MQLAGQRDAVAAGAAVAVGADRGRRCCGGGFVRGRASWEDRFAARLRAPLRHAAICGESPSHGASKPFADSLSSALSTAEDGWTASNAGTLAGAGCFRCEECGFGVALHELDEVPDCPHCGSTSFKRGSIFGDHAHGGAERDAARPMRRTGWPRRAMR